MHSKRSRTSPIASPGTGFGARVGRTLLLSAALATAPFSVTAQLVTGLEGGAGSTIGPAGDLFVTEHAAGRISRVDPRTGQVTPFASGLPASIPQIGFGGPVDVAFIGDTAYALVTLVGTDVGGGSVVGIYRVDGPSSFTVIADIGAFSIANPPDTDFFVPSGVQYALEAYRGGFLVTDGHHNRVLRVSLDGEISEFKVFGNIVPTGLTVSGNTVYMAQAGPVPHLPADGKIVSFEPWSSEVTEIASGARLAVDVEFGRGRTLYALSQGEWDGVAEGSPALPNTGALLEIGWDNGLTVVATELDRPTSIEVIRNSAYIVTRDGDILRIEGVSRPPFGETR